MAIQTAVTWEDIRAELGRRRVTVAEVALKAGVGYSRFSTLLNSDAITQPTPAFAEQVLAAIQQVADEKGR